MNEHDDTIEDLDVTDAGDVVGGSSVRDTVGGAVRDASGTADREASGAMNAATDRSQLGSYVEKKLS